MVEQCCRTPWGRSDYAKEYAPGIVWYGTPSHGGFKLDRERNAAVPDYMRREGGWYEEDCDWAIVATVHPIAGLMLGVAFCAPAHAVTYEPGNIRNVRAYYHDDQVVYSIVWVTWRDHLTHRRHPAYALVPAETPQHKPLNKAKAATQFWASGKHFGIFSSESAVCRAIRRMFG